MRVIILACNLCVHVSIMAEKPADMFGRASLNQHLFWTDMHKQFQLFHQVGGKCDAVAYVTSCQQDTPPPPPSLGRILSRAGTISYVQLYLFGVIPLSYVRMQAINASLQE